MSVDIRSSTAAVPEDSNSILIDGSKVKSKFGHVAKFTSSEDNISNDDELYPTPIGKISQIYSSCDQQIDNPDYFDKYFLNNQFIGLNKEELKSYINNNYWKRIRWIVGISYCVLIFLLFVGAIISILFSPKCPHKSKLHWYEKDIIYDIDIQMFRDSNRDGHGDIKGLHEKFDYFEKNFIKTILFRSTIFSNQDKFDLLTINPQVANETNLQNFRKILHRKDMNLMIDLPLSSTNDINGSQWYGNIQPLSNKIKNTCEENTLNLACRYFLSYGRLPLDFNQLEIVDEAEIRLRYWLSTQKFDGVRVDLPLEFNEETGLYNISYKTIHQWNFIKNDIEKNTKTKLILYDIPFDLNNLITENDLHKKITHPVIYNQSLVNAKQLNQRIQSFKFNHLPVPKFWQFGSLRIDDEIQNNLSKQSLLTMAMLFGGTPVVLYGEELGLEQKKSRVMLWTPDKPSGGFSSCVTTDCLRLFSLYNIDPSKTNVKREEAIHGNEQDSLLILFRYLAKLRRSESFQFGLLETGYDVETNIFWFIREAAGFRGYIIVLNLNEKGKEINHLSLHELTNYLIPKSISYEYQWPKTYFQTSNKTHINSDNLFLHPQSISIFSWKSKLIQPNILFKKAKNHLANQ
ncbi:unnamed protein product [Adineta steineri]|uniref:Glycosyl hydrolase family 13 catalytic domain-containing protein n=1 Tax=Adineta steineri TaxID=433720 RepID=A0A819AXR9_9BILA|nr:unnamed protein product [Adineta steineri]CAF3784611.1 unnamed protein product [Adineta steineri]